MTELNVADLLTAMDIIAMERLPGGSFRTIGNLPGWFGRVRPVTITGNAELIRFDDNSFLDLFLVETENFWRRNDKGWRKSDPWTEVDHSSDDEYVFEATAVCLDKRNFLLIQLLGASFRDREALFQKARENVLLNERLEQIVAERTTELLKMTEDLQKSLNNIVHVLALTVETRDPYTAGHQRRVADLARAIALEMSLSKETIESIYVSGLIHDLGKISVPAEILSKPTQLTEIECNIIKNHPRVGYNILKDVELPWNVAQIVLQHHEKINGSGYPEGLSGEDILLEARVIMVSDVVEAMASHRPYRPAFGIEKALEEIIQNRCVFYDPKVVDVCVKLFEKKSFRFE